MKTALGSNKVRIAVILLIVIITASISLYRSRSTKLLDKEAYAGLRSTIEDTESFESYEDIAGLIKDWADSNSLEYTEDKAGNIIFDREAVKRKKNVTPTLIAVSLNHETAVDNASVLAAAASIALSDMDSGRRTVVFFNDEQSLAKGYKKLDKSYITSKSKIIYLDKGSSTYLSTGSFRQQFSKLSVPAELTENSYDSAIKIHIGGLTSGVISSGINKQPDPFNALSSLLTRLKSKSVSYGISELQIGSNGNMYPVSLDVTIAMNSYDLSSFTSYIDKRIKAWDKSYGDDFEDLEYTYETVESEDAMPSAIYSAETCDRLAGILYTVQSGAYKYADGDALPDGKEAGDVYGINCLTALDTSEDAISISVITQGYDDSYTERILNDNTAAAELYGCNYKTGHMDAEFVNDRNSLSHTFYETYNKINNNTTADAELGLDTDNFFTPCSYLAARNGKSDIIHIRTKNSNASRVANTILCYIKAKGNTSIFK